MLENELARHTETGSERQTELSRVRRERDEYQSKLTALEISLADHKARSEEHEEAARVAAAKHAELEEALAKSKHSVNDLTGELTIEEIIQAVIADPEGQENPPGVDELTFVDPTRETRVDVNPPAMAVACGTEGGPPLPGPTFSVEG